MTNLTPNDVYQIMLTTAFYDTEDIWWRWREDDRTVLQVFANCADFFWWGTSDLEEITPENIVEFFKAYEDMQNLDLDRNFQEPGLLFCARMRKMRPQGAYYKYLNEKTWYLFDACGPERETGLGNPKKHPLEKDVQTKETSV